MRVEKVNAAESQQQAFGQGLERIVGSDASAVPGKSAAKVVLKRRRRGRRRQRVLGGTKL